MLFTPLEQGGTRIDPQAGLLSVWAMALQAFGGQQWTNAGLEKIFLGTRDAGRLLTDCSLQRQNQ